MVSWHDIFDKQAIQDAEAILIISNLNEAFKYLNPKDKVSEMKRLFQTLKSIGNLNRPIILPAFTHSFGETGIFDVMKTRPEQMGALPLFAFRDGAFQRTLSPITSYFLWPYQEKFEIFKYSTTFGDKSIFGWLKYKKCRVMCIGRIPFDQLGWLGVHHSEEINQVPYRSKKIFTGTLIDKNQKKHAIRQAHFTRKNKLFVKNDFSRLNEILLKKQIYFSCDIDRVNVSSVWCHDLLSVSDRLIKEDPYVHTNLAKSSI